MRPEISVVIATHNRGDGLGRCLRALSAALMTRPDRGRFEVIVVDDGSTDHTAEIARAHDVTLISHPRNLGVGVARNTGLYAARADIVAFVDDDCEPEPGWLDALVTGYADGVVAVGGTLVPRSTNRYLEGFLRRHNPLAPQELSLAVNSAVWYRFLLYLRRMWSAGQPRTGIRDVYALVGANMSVRRQAAIEAGGFDDRFVFGGEELDLCMRLARAGRLVFVPDARVIHHFEPSLRDTLRRSRAYGIGSARLRRKVPSIPPVIFPWPPLVLALLVAAPFLPGIVWPLVLAVAAALLPVLLYPQGIRAAARTRRAAPLLDAYVQLAQEACEDIGFAQGAWRYRAMTAGQPPPRAGLRQPEQELQL